MRCRASSRRRESQQGFALLLVFLMAAIVALMLYQQLPRVAFESEREKEQLLIDRGEQYTRAIQLYYLANNRQYPTSIDDLEKREKRFLRRRYLDPYTGKDEWRIIHTNGGFLTDSLVQKPVDAGDGKSQLASNTTGNTANGTNPADVAPQVNAAVLQRPSDRSPTPPPGFLPGTGNQDPSAQLSGNSPLPPITLQPQPGQGALPPITLQPQPGQGALPPITLQPQPGQGALPPITLQPNTGNQPGLPPITLVNPRTAGGQPIPGQSPGAIPGQIPGQLRSPQAAPGQSPVVPGILPGGIQMGVVPGFRIDPNGQLVPDVPGETPGRNFPGPGIPGQAPPPTPFNPPANQPGTAQGSPNTAINAINQLLTNPRQTTTPGPGITGSNQIGAIAGIASTHKGPSIKVYKDQTKYELWEFVFSPTASTLPGGGAGGPGIAPGAGPGMGPGMGPGLGPAGGPGGAPGRGGSNQPGGFGGPGGFGEAPGRGGPGQPGGIFQTAPIVR
jgi:hypothetical protein